MNTELSGVSWQRDALQQLSRLKLDGKAVSIPLAFAIGWAVWHMPPAAPLDERGVHFLATLLVGVTLWIFEAFDEYIVALMLVISWIVFKVVPSDVALSGFSRGSWFFLLGALGMGAAVNKSGLLHRVAVILLRRVRPDYRIYTFILTAAGLLVTPLLPEVKGRIAIISPLTHAICERIGFEPRSNGCAGLNLSAYVGFSQLTFMFLTGANTCLVGWSLLPEAAGSEFGWLAWALAALPAGIFTVLFLFAAVHVFFPLAASDRARFSRAAAQSQAQALDPLSREEWICLAVIAAAIAGWIAKPLHGIGEPWVALGALLVFLMTGVLDKKALKTNIDWGFLLFFGVIYGMGEICSQLKIDRWLMEFVDPLLSRVSFHPAAFLTLVLLFAYFVRFFLIKTPTVILLSIVLTPWAQDMGIHPGVVLLTVLIGVESWFLAYQTPSYVIAYHITEGKGFSHGQARKLMVAKVLCSLLTVLISVPYWRLLGYIRP